MHQRHQRRGTLSLSDDPSNSDEVEGANSNNHTKSSFENQIYLQTEYYNALSPTK